MLAYALVWRDAFEIHRTIFVCTSLDLLFSNLGKGGEAVKIMNKREK